MLDFSWILDRFNSSHIITCYAPHGISFAILINSVSVPLVMWRPNHYASSLNWESHSKMMWSRATISTAEVRSIMVRWEMELKINQEGVLYCSCSLIPWIHQIFILAVPKKLSDLSTVWNYPLEFDIMSRAAEHTLKPRVRKSKPVWD